MLVSAASGSACLKFLLQDCLGSERFVAEKLPDLCPDLGRNPLRRGDKIFRRRILLGWRSTFRYELFDSHMGHDFRQALCLSAATYRFYLLVIEVPNQLPPLVRGQPNRPVPASNVYRIRVPSTSDLQELSRCHNDTEPIPRVRTKPMSIRRDRARPIRHPDRAPNQNRRLLVSKL